MQQPSLHNLRIKTPSMGPLRHRDYRLFWVGACVSFIGSWVQMVAMGLFVYDLTNSKYALGYIGLAGGLPTTACMLFGGVIADRTNKRQLVLITQTLFALNAFTLAALSWMHTIQIWHIVALAFVNGLVFAVDGPTRQAMVHDLVGREELASAVALQSAAFNTARVIGPIVGAVLYAKLGAGCCFFVNGASFGAILIAILMIKKDLTQRGDTSGSVLQGLREGIQQLYANPMIRSVVGLTAVTSVFAFSSYGTLMPAFARDILHIKENDPGYGLLFSAIGVGSLLGALLTGKCSAWGKRGILLLCGALVFGVTLMVFAQVTNLSIALVLLVVLGASAISQLATANTLTQLLAPAGLRGRAVSAHMFAMGGLQPFGAYIAGCVAQRWGVPVALMFGASVFLIYTIGLLILKPKIITLK